MMNVKPQMLKQVNNGQHKGMLAHFITLKKETKFPLTL